MSVHEQEISGERPARGAPAQPLVSVILASFNHRDFVAAAVSSVLGQTYRNLELIIVDDGSLDGSADILRSFDDPRIQLHCLTENRRYHVRNFAIARAAGHFVAFQNSDDLWEPAKLQRQVEAFDEGRHSASFTDVRFIDEDGADLVTDSPFTTTERPPHRWLRHFFDRGNCLPLPSALVRRSDLLACGGFDASLVQLGDFDLWVRMAARGEFQILPEKLTRLRIMKSNLSRATPGHLRRISLEAARVLHRYVGDDLLELGGRVFPELPRLRTTAARKVALAERAIANGGHGGNWLFADQVLSSILADETAREEAAAELGSDFIRSFLEWRTRFELSMVPG